MWRRNPIGVGEGRSERIIPQRALGFFIRSNGGGVPCRLHINGTSFVSLSILPDIVPGTYRQDIPIILGSLGFVIGKCDG